MYIVQLKHGVSIFTIIYYSLYCAFQFGWRALIRVGHRSDFDNNAKGNNIDRRIIVGAWNNAYAVGTVNGRNRAIGPFRAVTNSGDFLSRQNYSRGGSNPADDLTVISARTGSAVSRSVATVPPFPRRRVESSPCTRQFRLYQI
jgi:hypothetical protein